jgi:hypothetical protein
MRRQPSHDHYQSPSMNAVALRLRDRREEILPSVGMVALRDLETGQELLVDTSNRNVRARFGKGVVERSADRYLKRIGGNAAAFDVTQVSGL